MCVSMEVVQAAAARKLFGAILDRARVKRQPTLILLNGKPAAVVVDVAWYEARRTAEDPQTPESGALPANSPRE